MMRGSASSYSTRLADTLLLLEAAWILRGVRWGLRRMRWAVLIRLLRGSASITKSLRRGQHSPDPAAGVLWAIERAGRSAAPTPSCLEEALSVQWMLRRRHVEAQVRIGVVKSDAGALLGHAWAEHAGRVMSVDPISPARYTVLTGPLDEQLGDPLDELHRRHLSL
jgi:hypothetical protein